MAVRPPPSPLTIAHGQTHINETKIPSIFSSNHPYAASQTAVLKLDKHHVHPGHGHQQHQQSRNHLNNKSKSERFGMNTVTFSGA